jgi:hypothetical protein
MIQRFILFAISILFISTVALAQKPSAKTPEHIRYYFVFRQLSLLNQKAVAAERKGENGSRYRQHYKKLAQLNDGQMSQLDQIANECLRDVAAYDDRIKQLVSEARAGIPGRRLKPGVPLPKASAELKQIDAERDGIIRRAYARLIDAFGETEFRRFNEVIEKSVRDTPRQVSAREGGPRENLMLSNPVTGITSVSIIQEVDGTVQLYAATSLEAEVYLFYDAGIVGGIYEGNPPVIKAQAESFGWMIAEVMLTSTALPATEYIGVGDSFVVAIFYDGQRGWYDPLCLSRPYCDFPYPVCDDTCYLLSPYIYVGSTYDSIITQGQQ